MGIELIIVLAIVMFVITYTKMVDFQELFTKNEKVTTILKEKDYDFLAKAKYGGDVDIQKLINKRIKNTGIVLIAGLVFLLFNFTIVNLVVVLVLIGFIYKSDYLSLKSYYKKHLQQINQLLPYYLKSVEVLAQHYTIPVAISRSINTAPDVFKSGLRELIAKIDAGDSSIEPYMEFANNFPVRDSMRMMRLLYRLSIGAQENKQDQLIVFSKSVSSLQNKAREKMYSARLEKMEKKTMIMLYVTGGGTLVAIFVAMLMML